MRINNLRLFWLGLRYFTPGFHPWKIDDSRYLAAPYEDYARAQLPPEAA